MTAIDNGRFWMRAAALSSQIWVMALGLMLAACSDDADPALSAGSAGASALPTVPPSAGQSAPATDPAGPTNGTSATAGRSGARPDAGATPPGAPQAGSDSSPDDAGVPATTTDATVPDAAPATDATSAPAPAAECDRACLTEINTTYLAALIANDPAQLATDAAVRFTENGAELPLGEGLWAVARTLGSYRQDFAEVPAGQTAGFVSLEDDQGAVLLAFRLKVVERKVTEIETTVCRTGEASFFAPDSLVHNDLYDQPLATPAARDELIAIVDSYFESIETGDGSAVPFADSARRNENGMVTGMGSSLQNTSGFSYIETIDRRYVLVDEERGNVLPWVLFQIPMGFGGSRTLHLAELFKVEGGKIMDVQAIMVNQPLGTPGGWE